MTLAELEELRQRVRTRVHSGAWFPALVIGLFVLSTIALYTEPFTQVFYYQPENAWAGILDNQRSSLMSYLFWFLGLPAVLGLIAWWYRRRERLTGFRVRWRAFLAVAAGSMFLLAAVAAVPQPPREDDAVTALWTPSFFDWLSLLITPLAVLAITVVALGWLERSRWLILCGCWIAFVVVWQSLFGGNGDIPGWLSWVLGGGEGPALGGQITLLGLNRPGPLLIVIALPLLLFALMRRLRDAS